MAGRLLLVGCVAMAAAIGCAPRSAQEVVVFTALDEEFSRPIFEEFTRETGIVVRAKFDIESTKSVGLTAAIIVERRRPVCDVFWNNEIVNTLRLDQAGLLAEYDSPAAKSYDQQYRSPRGMWFGFAARARVLVVNTELVEEDERPTSIHDLADEKWKDRVGIAKPLAGTTATHAACLFATWGDERAKEFFRAVKANARVMGGNKQVARAVAEGELAFGVTDTDDAIVEIESGMPVAIVFPDQEGVQGSGFGVQEPGDGGQASGVGGQETGDRSQESEVRDQEAGDRGRPLGTLLIPNTLSIVKGAAHRDAAEKLVEYLLSPEVEERLADGPSAQFPLNRNAKLTSRVMPKEPLVRMEVDFQAAAKKWDAAAEFLKEEFATAE